ncbi:ABC transporter permease [Pontibacter sp. MBLB2868]|uniref:ABC transporter permease n=1 Tax=Pontibacter sp. MBLB2868 TaxID=3451555 RepID=UPI003F753042
MKQLLSNISYLWHNKAGFRFALLYLALLLLIILMLPWLPLPYQPNELDLNHIYQMPFAWQHSLGAYGQHWLGTDALGRDVLANVLYGTRSAFLISFPVMLLSTAAGVLIGICAGFFGNKGIKISRAAMLVGGIFVFLFFYFGLYLPLQLLNLEFSWLSLGLCYIILIITYALLYKVVLPLLKKWELFLKTVSLPLDYLTLRIIESLNSIPNLLLILVIASFLPPSIFLLSFVIIAVTWTSTARLARAEMLKIRSLTYFEAARSIGLTQKQLLLRHALPNMLGPIIITFTFGVAGLLALESTLSFLGIGVPASFVSWGRTIAGIRANTSAWWLVVFPGGALALTVLALQMISNYLLHSFEQKK